MIKRFWGSAFGRAVTLMAVLDLLATPALLLMAKAGWIGGLWLSAVWFFVNSLMMWHIMQSVASGQKPDQRRILGWCIVKFPVLYLAGLGILLIPGIEVSGVLVTFTFFLISLGIVQITHIGKQA
jgi:hypothetical protein